MKLEGLFNTNFFFMEIIKIIKFYLLIFLLVILIKKNSIFTIKDRIWPICFYFSNRILKTQNLSKKNKTRDKYTNTFHKLFSIFFENIILTSSEQTPYWFFNVTVSGQGTWEVFSCLSSTLKPHPLFPD